MSSPYYFDNVPLTAPEVPPFSLRDYFAAKAMLAYASDEAWRIDMDHASTAATAYRMADAMLEAREAK